MPFCEFCRSSVKAEDRFCTSCGRPHGVCTAKDNATHVSTQEGYELAKATGKYDLRLIVVNFLRNIREVADEQGPAKFSLLVIATLVGALLVYGSIAGMIVLAMRGEGRWVWAVIVLVPLGLFALVSTLALIATVLYVLYWLVVLPLLAIGKAVEWASSARRGDKPRA